MILFGLFKSNKLNSKNRVGSGHVHDDGTGHVNFRSKFKQYRDITGMEYKPAASKQVPMKVTSPYDTEGRDFTTWSEWSWFADRNQWGRYSTHQGEYQYQWRDPEPSSSSVSYQELSSTLPSPGAVGDPSSGSSATTYVDSSYSQATVQTSAVGITEDHYYVHNRQ